MNKKSRLKSKKTLELTQRISTLSPILPNQDLMNSLKDLRNKYPRKVNKYTHNSNDIPGLYTSADKHIVQEMTSDRLSKGRKYQVHKLTKYETTQSEAKLKSFESNINILEESRMENFVNNIKVLKPLKSELGINFQVSRTEAAYAQINFVGLLYLLQDKLDVISNVQVFDVDTLSANLQSLNLPMRELIRLMQSNKLDKGAELLELAWRFTVKLIDTACVAHLQSASRLADTIQKNSQAIRDKKESEIDEIQKTFKKSLETLQNENKNLKNDLEQAKKTLKSTIEQLYERNEEIKKIFNYDIETKEMIRLKKLLNGLDDFIIQTEREQNKQINTLETISNIMNLVDIYYINPRTVSKEIQTDPIDFECINQDTDYEDYIQLFGTTFGQIGSIDSVNAFVRFIKKKMQPRAVSRIPFKRRTKA
jgi:hypothetical protein